jgi:hypothetical protein
MKKLFAAWTLAAVLFAPSMASIATDNFSGTNGDDIGGRTTTTGSLTWAEAGVCGFDIQTNKASYVTGAGNCMATVDASDASVTVQVEIDIPSANDYYYGLVARFSDANNFWLITTQRASAGTPVMHIYDITAGAYDGSCDSDNLGAISGTTITLKATTNSDTIEGYVGGSLVSSCTTASFNHTAPTDGFVINDAGNTTGRWDNFSIDSDPTGGGAPPSFIPAILNNPIRGGGIVRRRF